MSVIFYGLFFITPLTILRCSYHLIHRENAGSAACPRRGCFDCPRYAAGENPFFKERHRQAEHIRAMDFMASGEADEWRIVADL